MLNGAILRKTKELSQSETFKHIAVLFSGRAGVFLISIISHPILARLYTPAQFGEFALLNSILALLLVGASGRYEAGIILTRKPQQALRLFQLAQFVLLGYAFVISMFIFFAPDVTQNYINKQGLSLEYLWVIPLMVLFSGNWQIVHNWLIRFEKFPQIWFALIFQRILIFIVAVVIVLFPVPGNGLILSLFIGNVGIFIFSFFLQRQSIKVQIKSLRSYAYFFRDFPLFSIPTQFLNLFTVHLPVLWITFFYSKESAGAFSLAYSLTSVPLHLLHASLGQIFYQRLAQSVKNAQFPLILKYCKLYSLILIPIVLILTGFGKQLTQVFLGEGWAEAGRMISSMSLLMLVQALYHLFINVITVLRKQQLNLVLQVIQLVFCVIAFSIGYYFQDIYISLWLMVLFFIIHLVYTVNIVLKFVVPTQKSFRTYSIAN